MALRTAALASCSTSVLAQLILTARGTGLPKDSVANV
jgi:hypothetical protein